MGISISGLSQSFAQTNQNSPTALDSANWKTFTSDKLGISFEYPSDWIVQDKANRFENAPDVFVSKGLNMFKVIPVPKPAKSLIQRHGFQEVAEFMKNSLVKDDRLIEDIDYNKYSIGGKETGVFLDVETVQTGDELPFEWFIVNSEPIPITLLYQDTKDHFDSQASQDILNHIINSFTFLNG